eukprot:g4727.t1
MDYLPSFVNVKHSPLLVDQSRLVEVLVKDMDTERELDHKGTVCVIYALSQLVPGVRQFTELAKCLLRTKLEMQSFDLTASVILLYSLARLQINDEILLTPLVHCLAKQSHNVNKFPFEMISMVFYSLGKLKYTNWRLIAQLMSGCEVLGRFSTWDLSSLCYGISLMDSDAISTPWLDILAREVSRVQRLSTFSEQGLSLVLYSLTKLRFHDTKVIQLLLEEELKPLRVAELTYQGLCMVLHGLEKLPRRQRQSLHEQYSALQQLLADTVKLKSGELAGYNAHELVSFLFGAMLAKSGLESEDLGKILESVNDVSGGFGALFLQPLSPKEVLILIKALMKLSYGSITVWRRILDHVIALQGAGLIKETGILTSVLYITSSKKFIEVYGEVDEFNVKLMELIGQRELDDLSGLDLVHFIQSIAAAESLPTDTQFLKKLFTEVANNKRLTVFTQHQLVNLLASLVQLSTKESPPESLFTALESLKKQIQLNQVDDAGLVTLLYYFSKCRKSDRFLMELRNALRDRSGISSRLESEYLSMTIQSIANSELSDPELMMPLIKELMSIRKLREFSDKSLILILHSVMKLSIKNNRLLALSTQVLIQRGSLETMPLDLLSTLLYTLAKFQHYNKELFDLSLYRISNEDLYQLESVGCINILDALSHLGLHEKAVLDPLMEHLIQRDLETPFDSRAASSFMHAIGRLRLKDSRTKDYLKQLLGTSRLDAFGLSGLIYALIEADMTTKDYGLPIVELMESRGDLEKLRVSHLGNLIRRFPSFDPDQTYLSFVKALINKIDKSVISKEIKCDNFGQFIIGVARLAEQYGLTSDPVVCHTFESMTKSEILTQMSTRDLIGNISASSHHPKSCLNLVLETSRHLMKIFQSLSSCSNKELLVLFRSLPSFRPLPEIHELLIEVRRELNERRRSSLIPNEEFL